MRTIRTLALASLVPTTLLLAAACDVAGPGDDLGAVELRPGGGFACSVCGGGLGNSPVVNGSALSDFSLDGSFNAAGLRIIGAEFPGQKRFNVIVDPDTEQWIGLSNGSPQWVGDKLVGARLVLETPGGEVSVELTEIDEQVPSWANDGTFVTAYRALYKATNGAVTPLCPSLNIDEQWFTLIAGETYDQSSNSVHPNQSAWVTVACVGQAAAKMKMLGYGPNGSRGASLEDRQATLRMITADYCGTGQSFTQSGVHVAWRDVAGTIEPPFEEVTLEAKWGPNGALCLDTPRLVERAVVEDACNIPTCNGVDFTDDSVWRTMLP